MTKEAIKELENRRAAIWCGDGEEAVELQHAQGKLTTRERLERLLDAGSLREILEFVGAGESATVSDCKVAGGGVIAGSAKIGGRRVYLFAHDNTVAQGRLSEPGLFKMCEVFKMAMEDGLPVIGLYDSIGVYPEAPLWTLHREAELLWRQTQVSGVVPLIGVVLGPCIGAQASSAAINDFLIMTASHGQIFLTPEVVTSNQMADELDDLGSAAMHSVETGLCHLVATDDEEALTMTRNLLSYLSSNNLQYPYGPPPKNDTPWRTAPELDTIIPDAPSQPYDMHEVIAQVFDRGSFIEFQERFAPNAIVGLARLHGITVGVVAQSPAHLAGVIDIDASDKIARFVRTCDGNHIPLITFVDSPGFLPGVGQEHRGIIRHGAKIVYSYTEATVPKISVVTRKAYGGAYIVMSSLGIRTDAAFAWPTAELAVMGAEGAANILYRRQIQNAEDPEAERARLTEEYRERFANPYVAAADGTIDTVIRPSETRPHLISTLETMRDKRASLPQKKHNNMPL